MITFHFHFQLSFKKYTVNKNLLFDNKIEREICS